MIATNSPDIEMIQPGVSRWLLLDGRITAFRLSGGKSPEVNAWIAAVIETIENNNSGMAVRTLHDFSTLTSIAALDGLEEIIQASHHRSCCAFLLPKTIFAQDIQRKIEEKTNRYFAIRSRFFFSEKQAIDWLLQAY
jgi:hypothetical protein